MRIALAVLVLGLLCCGAWAQSTMVLGSRGEPPAGQTLSLTGNVDSLDTNGDGVMVDVLYIIAMATDGTDAVIATEILANGQSLTTCPSEACSFIWPIATMRPGINELELVATMTSGDRRAVYAKISKP